MPGETKIYNKYLSMIYKIGHFLSMIHYLVFTDRAVRGCPRRPSDGSRSVSAGCTAPARG